MNLAVSINLDSITPESLPPRGGEGRGDGRLRFLSLGLPIMGLSSFSRDVARYTGARDDIAAVHVSLRNSFRVKALSRVSPLPLNSDLKCFRAAQMWRRTVRSWCRPGGPLSIDRFDAVLVCPQYYAWGLADLHPRHPFALAVASDATTVNTVETFGDSALTGWPLRWAEQSIFRRADLVCCMGEWTAASVRKDYGVAAGRIEHIPPTADVPAPPPRPLPGDEPPRLRRIAFVGANWERKGGPELLRWHQQRWADRAELHIFSSEAPRDTPARNVVFHGAVPRDKLLGEVLPSMDLFALPTKRDMYPWAAVEAQCLGLPVVITRLAGTPDLIRDGVTGFLPARGDEGAFIQAIERLLDDPALCRRMGEAAREHATTLFDFGTVFGRLFDRISLAAEERRESEVLSAVSPSA